MNPRHMSPRCEKLPALTKLGGERYALHVPGAIGAQHNPSVTVHNGALVACVRVLSRRRTTNWLGEIDKDWRLIQSRPVVAALKFEFEDLRLFTLDGKLYANAAIHDGSCTNIRQAMLLIDGSAVAEINVWQSPRDEKNWMPVPAETRSAFRFVYAVSPLKVLAHGEAVPETQPAGFVRGGSQLVPYRRGFLAVVHEVFHPLQAPGYAVYLPEMGWVPIASDEKPPPPVVYAHRFVYFDAKLTRIELGPSWFFDDIGIEFCAGAAWWQDRLVLSYGWRDKKAMVAALWPKDFEPLLPKGADDATA